MTPPRSIEKLLELFASQVIVDLPTIRTALGNVSVMTTFRYLKQIPYRRSYSHNGRFYTLHDPSRYDSVGLWSFEGIHFSVDGSLKQTVRRLVHQAAAGLYHWEVQRQLQVRAHNTLLDLYQHVEVSREEVGGNYLYLHTAEEIRTAQLSKRQGILAAQRFEAEEVTDAVIIEVLLVLIRYPGSQAGDVARRLKGRSPPITLQHVRVVFDRYDLDAVGEKRGPSRR